MKPIPFRKTVTVGMLGILLSCATSTAAGVVDPEIGFGISLLSEDDSYFHHEFGWSTSVALPIRLWRAIDLAPQFEVRRHLIDVSSVTGGAISAYAASANIRFRLGSTQFFQVGLGTAQRYHEAYTMESSVTRESNWAPSNLVTTIGLGVNVTPTAWGDVFLSVSLTRGPAIWLNEDSFMYALRTGLRID